jgi:toluene monooxygenase system protein E
VLGKWIGRWSPRADEAAHALGALLETLPERGMAASDVAARARAARRRLLDGLAES